MMYAMVTLKPFVVTRQITVDACVDTIALFVSPKLLAGNNGIVQQNTPASLCP